MSSGRQTLLVLILGVMPLACATAARTRVLSVIFDGVPADGAKATPSQRGAKLPPAEPVPTTLPAPGTTAPMPPVIPPAPFEALKSWDDVLKALPLDADGAADWSAAYRQGLVAPRLLPEGSEPVERPLTLETLFRAVVTDPRRSALDLNVTIAPARLPEAGAAFFGVTFPHASHTAWLGCSSCHPGALAARVGMQGILKGESCGRCHGRVAFAPETGCSKCHAAIVPPAPEILAAEFASGEREPVAAGPDVIAKGQVVYRQVCAVCHGDSGNGAGPLAENLDPKPRDFTAGKFKFRTTLPTSIPTDLDLFKTITRGVPGTSMPPFAALPREDRWALTHYIKSLSDKFNSSKPEPIPVAPPPAVTPELLETGRDLYKQAGCNTCHGDTGRGDGPSAPTLKDDWSNPIKPFNFASGRPMKGGTGAEAVYRTVMTGLQGTPMPGFGDALTPEQGWALTSYVMTFFDQDRRPLAVRGDILFARDGAASKAPGAVDYPPALFPHWFHRIRAKCASCHPRAFEMRAGANAVSMDAMRKGQFCATCHNGKTAWEIGFPTCGRCHLGPQTARPSELVESFGAAAHTWLVDAAPDPSAALPESPNGTQTSVTRFDLGGVAGGVPMAVSHTAASSVANVLPAQAPEAGTTSGGWWSGLGQVGAAGVWAVGQFLTSGRWTGRTTLLVDRESTRNDVDAASLDVSRHSARAQVSVRNAELRLGPRLLTGTFGLDLQVSRDAYRVGRVASPGTGRLAGYDLGLTVMPDRFISLGVFGTRTEDVLPTVFGTARDRRLERRSAMLRVRGPFVDSTFDWTEESVESQARSDQGVLRDGETRRALSYTGTGATSSQSIAFDYRRERRVDRVFPAFSFPFETARFRYGYTFDSDVGGRNVVTSASFNRRGGTLRRDFLRSDTRLSYAFTPTLESRSSIRFERVGAAAVERRGQLADVRLQHKLYDSLVTTVAARGGLEEFQTGSRHSYGGNVLLEYRKKLPAGGRLLSRVGRTYDREANRFREREEAVFGEAHTAQLGVPIRLVVARVVAGSVVVGDAAESTIFLEHFDYTLAFIGEFAELTVLPGGRIRDGLALAIDDRVFVSPSAVTLTSRPQFDLAVDYGWFNPYLRTQRVSRDLVSGVDDALVFDQTSRTFGVRSRWNPRRVHAVFDASRRTDEARNLAFTSLQVSQVVAITLSPGRVLSFDVGRSSTRFRVPDRRESLGSGRLDLSWQVTPTLYLQATALARLRRDSLGFDETFYQAGAEARWRRVRLELFATTSRHWGERAGREFGGLRVSFGAIRLF